MKHRWITVSHMFITLLLLGVTSLNIVKGEGHREPSQSAPDTVASSFSYSGYLQEDGSPSNGSRDMLFRLYSDASCLTQTPYTGNIVLNNTPVNNGVFNVMLDVSPSEFDGGARWLEVQVDGVIIGCQQITAVPFAHTLRPGANVVGNLVGASAISAHNTASSGDSHGVYGRSDSSNGAGIFGINTADGLAGEFDGKVQVIAEGADALLAYGVDDGAVDAGFGLIGYTDSGRGNSWGAVYARSFSNSSGIYARTNGAGYYAGYFSGNIRVTGSCTGCTLVYAGVNVGLEPLETGDVVSVQGIQTPLNGQEQPLLQVQKAAAGTAVLGVIQSAGRLDVSQQGDEVLEDVQSTNGSAEPGAYVLILVQGLGQIKADATQHPIQAGDSLATGQRPGHAAISGSQIIGQAVEPLEQGHGLIWAMVGFHN